MVLGLRILSEKLNMAVCNVLGKKFIKWVNFTRRESARITRMLQVNASVEMQRHMRAYLARKRVRYLKEQIKCVYIYIYIYIN